MATAYQQQRDRAGKILVDLYKYLSDNVRQHPVLVPQIAMLSSAVAEYRTGQAPDPLSGARGVYTAIQTARQSDPTAPDP